MDNEPSDRDIRSNRRWAIAVPSIAIAVTFGSTLGTILVQPFTPLTGLIVVLSFVTGLSVGLAVGALLTGIGDRAPNNSSQSAVFE